VNSTPWGFDVCSIGRVTQSAVRSRSHCEYENGYLIFDNNDGEREVWRLASDFSTEGEVAVDSPPNGEQMAVSAHAATVYRHYAPRGHFRAWALLRPPQSWYMYRLAYPTIICASYDHVFLYDVRTGSLLQTINVHLQALRCVDVNERYAFVCEPDVVHIFSLESGIKVMLVPVDATLQCSQRQRVKDPYLLPGDWFITPLSVAPKVDECPRQEFIAGVFTHSHSLITQRFTNTSHSPRLQGWPRSRDLVKTTPRCFHSRL
jgi:hypothetical protein